MALALAIATCRAVCEKPQSGVIETRRASTWRKTCPDSLGDQFGRLDPRVLDVDQADGHVHGLGNLLSSSSISAISRLANSRASWLTRALTRYGMTARIGAMADRAAAIVSKTEMHADIRVDTLDRAGESLEEELGLAGMAGEARLVELDEVNPRGDQGPELGIDDGNQRRGDGFAAIVGRSAVDAARECERTRAPAS